MPTLIYKVDKNQLKLLNEMLEWFKRPNNYKNKLNISEENYIFKLLYKTITDQYYDDWDKKELNTLRRWYINKHIDGY
jgi:hypothetical protein